MHTLTLNGQPIPVDVKTHPRSRHISVRIHPTKRVIQVTRPRYVSMRKALAFLAEKEVWLAMKLASLSTLIPFAEGATIPIFGESHTIRHVPEGKRGVWLEEGVLCVSGDAAFIPRRVKDFLKKKIREELASYAYPLAEKLDRTIERITLKDTTSRWGSCSSTGTLSFSWRVVFAPREVVEYLVAHEVAHLAYMDHSPAFWETVGRLYPDYMRWRHWLKKHGERLYGYGG